jgi:hypothetical protein
LLVAVSRITGGFTMTRKLVLALSVISLAGCTTMQGPDTSNLAAYCTAENAYRLGSQSKAYFGVCPKSTESAFLAGLERGRALRPNPPQAQPYFQQMEALEKQLLAASSDAERQAIAARLREAEFWAVHIVYSPGTYSIE